MSLKISIIAGSHRHESESARVGSHIEKVLHGLGVTTTYTLDLAGNPLPLWDEGAWAGEERRSNVWGPIEAELLDSDGFVVISPEWSGMVPAGLKNFFLLCGKQVLAHKPALIVTVSAGLGGSYPVAELRMSSYKNTRICYIPEHVIVRQVGSMLKGDEPASDHDASLRERIEYASRILIEYATAMRPIRRNAVIDLEAYPHGM
jgi:NAD(P)H-dependent FMN reductase